MTNLLAVDFKRILKDKLFLVVCILAAVFAVITPLLYALLLGGMEEMLGAMGLSMSAKSQFFDSFSLGNNLGLIAPVLFAIILCKDFGQGTLRNKLIGGNTRTSILLSMFTVTFIVLFGMMLLHALLTFGLALVFFPYEEGTAFSLSELGYFLTSLALELVLYVFLAALIVWLCAVMKSIGLVIVGYIAIVMGMTVMTSLLQVGGMVLEEGTTKSVIEAFQSINVFNFAAIIGKGNTYELKDLLCCIFAPLIGAGALMSWSLLKFKRKDLK